MNILSFNTANFVAREIGYSMTEGWMQGDAATQAWYRPIDTFAGRFGAMLDEIVTLGFSAIDLWLAQLNPAWASDQHVALARQALDARSLNVATLAGFGDNREHVLRACQVALGVGATTFGHPAQIVDRDRAFVIEALGSRGLRLGIENHPEKTPAALRDRVGDGQGVIGAMIDTGWFGSQGYNAARAIVELKDVLFGIHLKDVLGSGAHHTCRFGQGVVPVRDCAQALRRIGYIGPISVEHEPERADPREDIRASAVLLRGWMEEPFNGTHFRASPVPPGPTIMSNAPTTIAIIGCGNIAGPYTQDIARYPHLRLKGVTDIDPARAKALADKAGCAVYPSVEAILADPEVSIVVNLTIFEAHYTVTRRALEAGKHVYSEKPLALNVADAQALVSLASERGLRLGCSPFVHLGEAQQTAWKLIRDGRLGQVRVAYAEVNHGRIETWHPNPVPFYAVGPLWDVGVYPLTLLTTMLGPARSVTAAGRVVMPDRVTMDGTLYQVTTPDFVIAAIEHAGGAISRLTASFYVSHRSSRQKSGLEFHGDIGSLALESWAAFDSPVFAGNFGEELKPVDLIAPIVGGTPWGTGIAEMAQAIAENRPQRVTGDQAAHIVEILEAISNSIRTERPVGVHSGFPSPVPMPWAV